MQNAPQLPFRSAFLAKLNVIRRAFGSAAKAAGRIGVTERHFFRWMADENCVAPARRNAKKVDDAYFLAIEKLNARRKRSRPQEHGESDFGIDPIDNV
jgi:hypothetical protein